MTIGGLIGLNGAITLANGINAYAYTIRYDNDGSFIWTSINLLDITKPASEQLGIEGYGISGDLYHFILSGSDNYTFAVQSPSPAGEPIAFQEGQIIDESYTFYGPWAQGHTHYSPVYFGLKLPDGNYGWILSKYNLDSNNFEALAWGYETRPGIGIAAGAPTVPEPGSLAMLATGAVTLAAYKKIKKRN